MDMMDDPRREAIQRRMGPEEAAPEAGAMPPEMMDITLADIVQGLQQVLPMLPEPDQAKLAQALDVLGNEGPAKPQVSEMAAEAPESMGKPEAL